MHPQELTRRRWQAGDLVRVRSRRGALILPVQASESVAPAQAFIAMHWGEEFVSGQDRQGQALHGVNALCTPAYCPTSKQPELKHTAVQVERVAELSWRLAGAAWIAPDQWMDRQQALRGCFQAFAYAACVPFGREPDGRVGLLFRAAADAPASSALVDRIEGLLGLDDPLALRYADPRRGQRRAMRLGALPGAPAESATLDGFLLAGDTAAQDWVLALLKDGQPARGFGRALLTNTANPLGVAPRRGAQVCTCFDVREPEILATLARCQGNVDERLAQLQGQLRCGTNCGSCLPALRKLVRTTDVALPTEDAA